MPASARHDEQPARPRRVYFKAWEFSIGESVTFGDMEAVVVGRHASTKGRALYDVKIGLKSEERQYRTVFSNFLHTTNEHCQKRTISETTSLA